MSVDIGMCTVYIIKEEEEVKLSLRWICPDFNFSVNENKELT
jgi:hypothetical protein